MGLLGRPWAPQRRFPEFSRKFWEAFWLHFGFIFDSVSLFVSASFFDRFLKRLCFDFGMILEAFFVVFF